MKLEGYEVNPWQPLGCLSGVKTVAFLAQGGVVYIRGALGGDDDGIRRHPSVPCRAMRLCTVRPSGPYGSRHVVALDDIQE